MTSCQTIPMLDMSFDIDEHWDDYQAAFSRVMRSGRFIRGPEVAAFEERVADYLGVRHAIGVNSGTDALVLGLRALDIGRGDEVITTPFTFAATPESICLVGATPVFVDIDPVTFNIDPNLIEAAITDRTRAIMPVHLFGLPADMPRICEIARRHDLRIIEDAAQAFGADTMGKKAGTIGEIGAFSFFPSKNLGGFGDGGLIATNDPYLAELVRALSAHGAKVKYQNRLVGYNSRLDELQAALLRIRLPLVDKYNFRRQQIAERYIQGLSDLEHCTLPSLNPTHVFHQFTIRVPENCDDLALHLRGEGIATARYYPVACHDLPAYRSPKGHECPVARSAARECLSLPIGCQIAHDFSTRVIDRVRSFFDFAR